MTTRIRILCAALVVAVVACGGGGRQLPRAGKGPPPPPKLDAVKPAAMREYEAAMRALRLGGPEANQTARARLQTAVGIDGSLWEAWHNLGVIASEDGEDDTAIEMFGKALAINRSHTPSRLARAEAHRRAGHPRDARADFETAVGELGQDDPLRSDAAARLASVLRDAGNYDDAIGVLRDSLRVSGPSARIYTELGLIYLAQKRYDMVTLVLARARELAEDRIKAEQAKTPPSQTAIAAATAAAAPVWNALALLALRQGKAQEAFARFDQATTLDPKYVDARFNKASVLLDAGDFGRAEDELDRVLDQAPDDLAAQVALGVALRGKATTGSPSESERRKGLKEAEKVWERVVKRGARRDPARADALFNLAILKADFLEDVAEGKRMLEQYLQDAPGNHPKRQAAADKQKELGL
jgi:tetratricopeptide (TPR) repeat protein